MSYTCLIDEFDILILQAFSTFTGMNSKQPILECVPNFSEGRDEKKIEAIADAIKSVRGNHLLHIDTSPSANRTVMTFAGEPEAVAEAAYLGIKRAAEVIDMSKHGGVHPRIGATDVCPLVPLAGLTIEDANTWANMLGKRVGEELNIPVYLYEYSALKEHRRALPDIRKGQYEGFAEKIKLPDWLPDYGPAAFNLQTGATVIGARNILVAFNISLNTKDVNKATYIAEHIRERGYIIEENGKRRKLPGLLSKVRAIGWYMEDYETAQVSMNLLDYRVSSPLKVWETCNMLAAEVKTSLLGCEVIGLIPLECMVEAGTFAYLKNQEEVPNDEEMVVHTAIDYLGFKKVKPFDAREKILEYALKDAGLLE